MHETLTLTQARTARHHCRARRCRRLIKRFAWHYLHEHVDDEAVHHADRYCATCLPGHIPARVPELVTAQPVTARQRIPRIARGDARRRKRRKRKAHPELPREQISGEYRA